jgi:quercetin dioxygenase-like cupin family protein
MARPGDVLRHPAFGAQIRFLHTSQETDGQLLRVEVTLPPRFSMPEHVHPRQEERHEVVSGTLQARVGGVQRDYAAGERVIGPPNVPHAWRNPSDQEDLRLVSEHRPVLHMEMMLENGFAIARDLWTDMRHAPRHLLRAAILMDEVKEDFYFTGLSTRALMALFVALAPVGRWFGFRSEQTAERPTSPKIGAALAWATGFAAASVAAVAITQTWGRHSR